MPLSNDQKMILKTAVTSIKFDQENPKTPGSKAFQRYDKYKPSKTVGEAMGAGANWQDITGDFERGLLVVVDVDMPGEGGAGSSVKRGAPEGTPDREASARAKAPLKELVPRSVLNDGMEIETSRVEMSSATIAALRSMMREELANGLQEMEGKIVTKMEGAMGELKKELAQEKEARKQLEERVRNLEQSQPQNFRNHVDDDDMVDKSRVVIGGFVDVDAEEAEKLVSEALCTANGFQEVQVTNPTPTVVFAQFDTPANAMRLIRSQKWNPKMLESKLWASENRSLIERRRCKAASKIKKGMIEHQGLEAKDIAVNYRKFSVRTRQGNGWKYACWVTEDADIKWSDDACMAADVKEAIAQMVFDIGV